MEDGRGEEGVRAEEGIDFRILTRGTPDDPVKAFLSCADELEKLGFGGLWVAHSIIRDMPIHDAIGLLAAVAGRTTRIKLGTAGLLVPLYAPASLAQMLMTVDHLSNGP